jgi:hypothetical protein
VDSQVLERFFEHLSVAVGRIVGSAPSRRLDELVPRRLERTEVLPVLAGALVDERVQLEVDLIEARREMDGQRLTERPRLDAIEEAGRQPEIDQVGRAGVEPVLWKPEVCTSSSNADDPPQVPARRRASPRLRDGYAGCSAPKTLPPVALKYATVPTPGTS